MLGNKGDIMDEFIKVSLFAVLLLWIATVAYMIYKDHGIIEYIDGEPYQDLISIIPSKNGDKLNLGKRFKKRFKI
jgi:hypothetical protein